MNAKQLLSLVFSQEENTSIPFIEEWKNGTGYFDNAVKGKHAPVVSSGTVVKTIDDNGRKIIIVGTPFGNVVVFERYTDQSSSIVVSNIPQCVKHLFGSLVQNDNGSMSVEGVAHLLGVMYGDNRVISTNMPNVGILLNNLK